MNADTPRSAGRITAEAEPPVAPNVSSYVLVVDDEAAVREYLTRRLESWGYTVKQAGSAAEALELMVTKAASAVLCDVKMPGQDGLWLTERLRAHWPATPVIMATAIDDMQTVRQSRDLGAIDYITKPIRPEQLLEVLRRATAASQQLTPASSEESASLADGFRTPDEKIDAEYTLECPVRCPACGERITTLKAVRLVRSHVNFTSTLPRRGRVIACPHCLSVVPAELSNF